MRSLSQRASPPPVPSRLQLTTTHSHSSVRGRPHYYSSKKEEYAIIKFSLDADLSSLFTWNTKNLFVYVTAEWPSAGGSGSGQNATNQAVIWDSIITAPSADHLANLGPVAMKKLKRSAQGKSIDPSRYVPMSLLTCVPACLADQWTDRRTAGNSPSRTSAPSTRSRTRRARWPRRTTSC